MFLLFNFVLSFILSYLILIIVSASWIYLYAGGTYQVIDDENYQYFLEMIKNRDPDTPIMTVSNHRSLLDDPLILSALLPVSIYFISQLILFIYFIDLLNND